MLRRRPLRESEEMLSLLTPDRGRLDCVVRRGRRSAATLEPFTHIQGEFAQGRELVYLNEHSLIQPYTGLRERLLTLEVGGHWLWLMHRCVAPDQDSVKLFMLLVRALSELEITEAPLTLGLWMELRVLKLLGLGPELQQCCLCGRNDPASLRVFSAPDGGILCGRCGAGRLALPPSGVAVLRHLQDCRILAVAQAQIDLPLLRVLSPSIRRFFELHCLDRPALS